MVVSYWCFVRSCLHCSQSWSSASSIEELPYCASGKAAYPVVRYCSRSSFDSTGSYGVIVGSSSSMVAMEVPEMMTFHGRISGWLLKL